MKLSVAQIKPVKGDIAANIVRHLDLIALATSVRANAVFFPELSLTGYEPALEDALATTMNDERLNIFQTITNERQIVIGLGLPTRAEEGIAISMIVFQPGQSRVTYSKQQLCAEERPCFVPGNQQVLFAVEGVSIAPAICYESLQASHAAHAHQLGADIYLASVAKSQAGLDKARRHYPDVARKYAMPVLMSNCIGQCDGFESAGGSGIWTKDEDLAVQLTNSAEGIAVYDTETEMAFAIPA